jgi:hypothetical protein
VVYPNLPRWFLLAIFVAPRRYDEMGNALQHIRS